MDELLEEFERERTILEGADNVILQYYDVETKETLYNGSVVKTKI